MPRNLVLGGIVFLLLACASPADSDDHAVRLVNFACLEQISTFCEKFPTLKDLTVVDGKFATSAREYSPVSAAALACKLGATVVDDQDFSTKLPLQPRGGQVPETPLELKVAFASCVKSTSVRQGLTRVAVEVLNAERDSVAHLVGKVRLSFALRAVAKDLTLTKKPTDVTPPFANAEAYIKGLGNTKALGLVYTKEQAQTEVDKVAESYGVTVTPHPNPDFNTAKEDLLVNDTRSLIITAPEIKEWLYS